MELNRRSFVKGAGLAGLASAGMAASALAEEPSTQAFGMPETWDVETDVVVIGTGTITPAALRAHEEGLDVVMLEAQKDWFGGTTALCGGGMSAPNNNLAKAAGAPEIPHDVLKDYLEQVAEGQSSDELIEMMIANYAPAVDFMVECGIKWAAAEYSEDAEPSYNLYRPFNQLEDEYAKVPCTVFAGMTDDGKMMGRAIQEFFKNAVEERDIPVMYGTRATKLIYSGNPLLGDGEVVGVWAQTDDGTIAVKARYGVIIGTGGFDHNREMVDHYINAPIYATTAVDTNVGDGHIMAMEVGADLRNMNEVYHQLFTMPEGTDKYQASDLSRDNGDCFSEMVSHILIIPGHPGAIMVNAKGQRFCNEGSSYDLMGRVFDAYDNGSLEWANIPAYLIMDETFGGNLGNALPTLKQVIDSGEVPEWLNKFDSMEELADGMGIDKENLLATVERFNGFCEQGKDLDFRRGEGTWDLWTSGDTSRVESGELKNRCLAPLENGPFYCLPLYPGMLQTAGGVRINGAAQVLNVRGEVIPRLYCGSTAAQSPTGRGYGFGGATLANGIVTGYVAAGHIATLEPWE